MPRGVPRAIVWLALLALACATPEAAPERAALPAVRPFTPPARVVVVTVAGLAAEALSAPTVEQDMPTVAALGRRGVRSDGLEPVVPADAYPAHATYVTGLGVAGHRIAHEWLLGDTGVRPTRMAHSARLRGTPIWGVVEDAGLATLALAWPTTLGAGIDHLLPDVERPVGDSWLAALGSTPTPWIRERLAGTTAAEGWPGGAERDGLIVDLACQATGFPVVPSLWLLRLTGPADAAVSDGPGSPAVRRARAATDAQLARLLDCLGAAGLLDSTAILVLGDAVFHDVHTVEHPNVALRRAGLLTASREGGVISWSAIARSSGTSAFVYARGEKDAVDARAALGELAAVGNFRVVSAAELHALGGDPDAWFGLTAAPGILLGNDVRSPYRRQAPVRGAAGGLGGPDRLAFVAWGPGLRQALRVPWVRAEDVAPTVAALLGLQLRGVDGRAMIGLLDIPAVPGARRPEEPGPSEPAPREPARSAR